MTHGHARRNPRPDDRPRHGPSARRVPARCATPRCPTSGGSARTTRTPASPASTCSSSPTAWAARRTATWPARPPSRCSAGSTGRPPADMLEALAGAIHRAHDRLAELVEQDPELDGTSTTVTAALFDGNRLGFAHVGDSRGYLLRDGTCSQLTKDHTFVQTLIDEGRITEEESRIHPHRNLILRAVDGVHDTDPDLFYVELAPGDRLLLCSDGASGVLDHERIADILGSGSIDYARGRAGPRLAGRRQHRQRHLRRGRRGRPDRRGRRTAAGRRRRRGRCSSAPPPSSRVAPARPRRLLPRAPRRRHRRDRPGPGRGGRQPAGRPRGAALRTAGPPAPPVDRRRHRAPGAGAGGGRGRAWSPTAGASSSTTSPPTDSHVAIYRGVQADLPGVTMNRVAQETDVTIASLPDFPPSRSGRHLRRRPGRRPPDRRAARRTRRGSARRRRRPPRRPRRPTPTDRRRRKPGATANADARPRERPTATPSPTPVADARARRTASRPLR